MKTSMSSDIWTKSKPDYFVDYTKTVDVEDVCFRLHIVFTKTGNVISMRSIRRAMGGHVFFQFLKVFVEGYVLYVLYQMTS